MKRLWIILLISLVWAAFSKVEGTDFVERDFFPFSDWTMIWPVYLWNICLNTVPAAFVWTLARDRKAKGAQDSGLAYILQTAMVHFDGQ